MYMKEREREIVKWSGIAQKFFISNRSDLLLFLFHWSVIHAHVGTDLS